MMLSNLVTSAIPTSSKAVMSSIGMLSGPAALPVFILCVACSTSSFRIGRFAVPVCIGGIGPL